GRRRARRGGGLMATFDYVAVDAGGRTVTGAVTAADEPAARSLLERRRLMPLEIAPGGAGAPVAPAASAASARPARLSPRILALTTRQLATLVSVTSIDEALRTIALQADRPAVRRVLDGVHGAVLEGRRL